MLPPHSSCGAVCARARPLVRSSVPNVSRRKIVWDMPVLRSMLGATRQAGLGREAAAGTVGHGAAYERRARGAGRRRSDAAAGRVAGVDGAAVAVVARRAGRVLHWTARAR